MPSRQKPSAHRMRWLVARIQAKQARTEVLRASWLGLISQALGECRRVRNQEMRIIGIADHAHCEFPAELLLQTTLRNNSDGWHRRRIGAHQGKVGRVVVA